MTQIQSTESDSSPEAGHGPVDELQVIAVRIGNELFCLDILAVREIVRTAEFAVTRVPNSHPYVRGVVNLRGKVVPVVDVSRRLGLGEWAEQGTARLVVVEVEDAIVGLTVDSVSEVLSLPGSTFADTGREGGQVGTVNGRIMTLLDPRVLLGQRRGGGGTSGGHEDG